MTSVNLMFQTRSNLLLVAEGLLNQTGLFCGDLFQKSFSILTDFDARNDLMRNRARKNNKKRLVEGVWIEVTDDMLNELTQKKIRVDLTADIHTHPHSIYHIIDREQSMANEIRIHPKVKR